jgi:site-specific recombinase XerD
LEIRNSALIAPSTQYSAVDFEVSEETADAMRAGVAESTRVAYKRDQEDYEKWCASTGRVAIPATQQTHAEYARYLMSIDRAPRSIQRAFGAIRAAHRAKGYQAPDGKGAALVVRGYRTRRAKEGVRDRKAAPLLLADLRRMVDTCDPDAPAGVRDRALIVLGFAMMARRSELVALDLADLDEVGDGLEVLVRFSKTDQDAVGVVVAVPYGSHAETCPVRLIRAWRDLLAARGFTSGPLFRGVDRHGRVWGEPQYAGGRATTNRMSGDSVGLVLRRAAQRAGISVERWSAHSLRSGGATEAYRATKNALTTGRQGRWKDGSPVLLGYIRTVDKWTDNPMKEVGL